MVKEVSVIDSQVKDWDNGLEGQAISLFSKREMNALIPPRGKELVVITVLRHPVHIKKDFNRVRSKAQLNMILSPGDHKQVEASGRAELVMTGGRVIRLDGGFTLEIASLGTDQETNTVIGRFNLFLGRMWRKILKSKILRNREICVSTSTPVAGVRATA